MCEFNQSPSILSYRYQNYETFGEKYRIGIVSVSKFMSWKVSYQYQYRLFKVESISISITFSINEYKKCIKISITPNYTLFWILKCNKNGYFHYFWSNNWLFLPKNWYQSWYQTFLHEYQYQYRYRISELHGISISIGIKTSDLYSISIVSVSTFQTWKVSVSYRYRKKWYRRALQQDIPVFNYLAGFNKNGSINLA